MSPIAFCPHRRQNSELSTFSIENPVILGQWERVDLFPYWPCWLSKKWDPKGSVMHNTTTRTITMSLLLIAVSIWLSGFSALAAEHTKDSLDLVKARIAEKEAVLIDVRERKEWDAGHLADAVFVPLGRLQRGAESEATPKWISRKLSKDTIVYCHCRSGSRVLAAADILTAYGYDVRPLKTGYGQLLEAGFAKAKRKPATPLPAALSHLLLSEKRDEIERADLALDALELEDGDIVADIGAGVGYYSLRIAKRVAPRGRVLAVDIQQGMLDKLMIRMKSEAVDRIVPILGKEDDPMLPAGLVDWVLLVDAYHEFSQPEVMLRRIRDCLSPEGRVALLEYRGEEELATVKWIPRDHRMSISEVMEEWTAGGFDLVKRHDFLPAQHFFIFKIREIGEAEKEEE